ncbi:MAG: hypothetical protein Kow0037_03950 [Calditrichia bacterium]
MESEKKGHILVIDDDELIISLLTEYFTDLGYSITSFRNAEEALKYIQKPDNPLDMVMSDINLPGRSGIDLVRIIRETRVGLPVVLITGSKTLDTAIQAIKVGAHDYITKPFDLASVRKTVERVFKTQGISQKIERVYEHLQQVSLQFAFSSADFSPGLVARELSKFLKKINFAGYEEVNQFELAFTETLINAHEHGNLELPSSIKGTDFEQLMKYEALKEERLNDPLYANRKILVKFECNPEVFSFTVKDEGPGFDWRKFLAKNHQISPVNTSAHGRGFMIIRHIIDEVHFNDAGNMITLIKTKV